MSRGEDLAIHLGKDTQVRGVTLAEMADCAPVPTAFTAATLNLYAVPLVRPLNGKAAVADPTKRVVAPVTPVAVPPALL